MAEPERRVLRRRGMRAALAVGRAQTTDSNLVIAALGLGRELEAELMRATHAVATVRAVSSVVELRDLIAREVVAATFILVPPHADGATVNLVHELSRGFRRHRFVGVYDRRVSDHRAIMTLTLAGMEELVTRETALRRSDVAPALAKCRAASTADAIVWRMGELLEPALADLMHTLLRRARAPVTVTEVATQLRVHRRTITKWTDLCGVVAPQQLLGWCRVLLIAYYLEDSGRTLDDVAERLQFPSPSNCRGFLKRYVGVTASALRTSGALQTAIERFARHAFRIPKVLPRRQAG